MQSAFLIRRLFAVFISAPLTALIFWSSDIEGILRGVAGNLPYLTQQMMALDTVSYLPNNTYSPKWIAWPLDSWLRAPLCEWAESLLDGSKIKKEDFFNLVLIRKKWLEHLSGRYNGQHQLWY